VELGPRLQFEVERVDDPAEGLVPARGRGDPDDRLVVVPGGDLVVDDRVDLAADDRDRVLDEGRLVVVEGPGRPPRSRR